MNKSKFDLYYIEKTILVNKFKINTKEEGEIHIKNKDEISFPNTDICLRFKFIEHHRSRSRSPPNKSEIKLNANDLKSNTHVKSEVVWNAVNFDNKNKKEKFLRLMGAYKCGKTQSSTSSSIQDKLTEELALNFKKIENDLTTQFYQTIGRKYNN